MSAQERARSDPVYAATAPAMAPALVSVAEPLYSLSRMTMPASARDMARALFRHLIGGLKTQ